MPTFHSLVCMTESLASVAGFIFGLVKQNYWPPLWYTSLILFFSFPVINECFLTLKGYLFRGRVIRRPEPLSQDIFPIVYSTTYNIHAFGLEKLHPFDASKYRRVFDQLVESGVIDLKRTKLFIPEVPSREFL